MSNAYSIVQVGDIIQTKNDKSKQLQSSEYLKSGVLPIVDQGAKSVCGYTNDLTKSYDKGLPVVIFGDHTLHTKYVDFNFAIGADGTQVLTPKSNDCDVKYLYYLITRAAELIGSEGYKRHFKILKEFDVEYVDCLPEQQKIATILSSVDDVIEKTRAQIDKLKDLKTGMMQELLTKGIGHTEFKDSPLGLIPTGWGVMPLGEIAKFSQGIQVGVELHFESKTDERVRFLRISDYSKSKEIPRYIDKKLATKGSVGLHDIVMVRYGEPGRVYRGFEGVIANNLFTISPAKNIETDYLFLFLSMPSVFEKISLMAASSTMPAINFSSISNLDVVIPAVSEQVRIAQIVTTLDTKINIAIEKLFSIEAIKKALMQDLLTGKVRVNLTDKESAVV